MSIKTRIVLAATFALAVIIVLLGTNWVAADTLEERCENSDFYNRLQNKTGLNLWVTVCDGGPAEVLSKNSTSSVIWDVEGIWSKCPWDDSKACVYKLGRGQYYSDPLQVFTTPNLPRGYVYLSGTSHCRSENDKNEHCGWKEVPYGLWDAPPELPEITILRVQLVHCNKFGFNCVPQENDPVPSFTCNDIDFTGVILFDKSWCHGSIYEEYPAPVNAISSYLFPSSLYVGQGWSARIYDNENHHLCAHMSYWDFSQDYYPDTTIELEENIVGIQVYNDTTCGGLDMNSDGQLDNDEVSPPSSDESDSTPPTAFDFSAAVSGGVATLNINNLSDDIGGSGVDEVRYSAKWNNEWHGIGIKNSYPYSLAWNMCADDVPNGDVEFGMEVWDYAGNKWVWSEHFPNPHVESSCGGSSGWLFEFSKAQTPPLEVDIHVKVDDTDLDAFRVCIDAVNCQEKAAPNTELFYTWNTYGWSDGLHTFSIQYRRTSDSGDWDNALLYKEDYYLSPIRSAFAPCDGGNGVTLTSGSDCIRVIEDVGDLMPVGWSDRSNVTACVIGGDSAWVYDGVLDNWGNFNGIPKLVYSGQCKNVGDNISSIDIQESGGVVGPLPDIPFVTEADTIAHYRFDTNAVDETGNYNGSIAGSATYVAGVFGSALNAPNPPDGSGVKSNPFNLNSFTLDVWLARPAGSTGGRVACQLGGGGNTGQNKWCLHLNGNRPELEIWSAGGSQILQSPYDLPDDESWHYINVSYDGTGSAVMYVDNIYAGTLTTAGVMNAGATTFEIGMGEGIYSCNCKVDELRLRSGVHPPEISSIATPTPEPSSTPVPTVTPTPDFDCGSVPFAEVGIFDDKYCKGSYLQLEPGFYNLTDLNFNDLSSAVYVPEGSCVEVYEHIDGAGESRILQWSYWDLSLDTWSNGLGMDNTISSIEVFDNGDCTPPAPTSTPIPTATSTPLPLIDFIIINSTLPGYEAIYKADPDGTNWLQLAGDGSGSWKHAGYPRVSPNGQWVAYEAHNGPRYLWIVDMNGNNRQQLFSSPIHHARITWSPDSSKILFIGEDGTARTIEPDGSNLTVISGWPTDFKPTSWCSNGRILAHYYDGNDNNIYSLDPDGSNIVQLTTDSAHDSRADWSPDCSQTIFESNRTGQYEIWKMDADGSNQTQLTNTPNNEWSLYSIWSPDGSQILFSSSRDSSGYWELFTMNADGSNVTNITNTNEAEQWSDWGQAP